MIGRTLAHFEITAKLGEGGMGDVYLARDSRLGREVALKVLPGEMAADRERLERFRREAQSLAALNHPNIVTIHSVEEADGVHLLAMERVDGESLDQQLPAGGFDLEALLPLAIQITAALAAAHEAGITHRDLKPANVMVAAGARVKILDFGLAKPAASDAGEATQLMTRDGMILGTVPYMSPEQVQGQAVDHRSDIFSLGVVLYEMATGERPFQGDNPASLISAVLRHQPPRVTEIKAELPNHFGRIVRRCLEKDRERRYQSARDLQLELEGLDGELASAETRPGQAEPASPAAAGAAARPRSIWPKLAAAGVLCLLVGLGIGHWLRRPLPLEPPRVRALTVSGHDSEPAASPDGHLVAFQSNRDGRPRIWIKQLASGGEEPVTDGPDSRPRFSPDGSALLFARDEGGALSIYRQGLVGGAARKVIDEASDADWSPDGTRLAFTRSRVEDGTSVSFLGLTDGRGSDERILLRLDKLLSKPRWSPDGSALAVLQTPFGGGVGQSGILLVDPETGEWQPVGRSRAQISSAAWAGTRSLVFAWSDSISGDQGDPLSRLVFHALPTGAERTLFWTENLFPFLGQRLDATTVDVLGADSLVFHRGSTRQTLREIGVAGAGKRLLTRTEGIDRQPYYSSDGRQVLFSSNRSGNLDLWRLDLDTGAVRQLTDDPGQDYDPALSPDGQRLIWTSDRSGNFEIWIAGVDGSGARQVSDDDFDAENPTMTADGAWIVYWSSHPEKLGVWKIRPDGSEATQVAAGRFANSEVSRDGRYVAYLSQSPDNLETLILVSEVATGRTVPFQIRVAAPLGAENIIFGRCRWFPDSRRIAFIGVDEKGRTGVFDQLFEPGRDTSASRRRLAGFADDSVVESFDLSPDGTRLTLAVLEYTWQVMLADGVRLAAQ
jgi:Tol biopolymer transport system component